jgi:MORN repeat variant
MMITNLKKISILIIVTIVCFSCSQKEKHYYDSGELWYEKTLINKDSCLFHIKAYYKNGKVKEEGNSIKLPKSKGIFHGHWRNYFSDGVLRFEGDFDHGHLVALRPDKWPDYSKIPVGLQIEGNPKVLKVGKTYKMRLIMPSIYYTVCQFTNPHLQLMQKNPQDSDRYTYIYTPRAAGTNCLFLIFPLKDSLRYVFAKSLKKTLTIKVEK